MEQAMRTLLANSLFADLLQVVKFLSVYRVLRKKITHYLQAVVVIWQLWMRRINDLQKHKVLYTVEINNSVIYSRV